MIIELDGAQHFRQVSTWRSAEETQFNDFYKMYNANQNKIRIIRLLQEDVLYDKYDWLTDLFDAIKKMVRNKKIQNVFLCKNNEYELYISNYQNYLYIQMYIL